MSRLLLLLLYPAVVGTADAAGSVCVILFVCVCDSVCIWLRLRELPRLILCLLRLRDLRAAASCGFGTARVFGCGCGCGCGGPSLANAKYRHTLILAMAINVTRPDQSGQCLPDQDRRMCIICILLPAAMAAHLVHRRQPHR